MPEAREALDRLIARLIEELNVMGFAFHHPIAPFGRQPGEGSSRDLEVRKGAGQELKGVGDTMRLGPVARRRPPGTRAGWAGPPAVGAALPTRGRLLVDLHAARCVR